VCNSRTTNPAKDLVASDTVFANDDMMAHSNGNQQWFYMSDQMADELLFSDKPIHCIVPMRHPTVTILVTATDVLLAVQFASFRLQVGRRVGA